MLVLGAMHFANMYVFSRLRRRAMYGQEAPPPVAPDACINPNEGAGPWAAPAM